MDRTIGSRLRNIRKATRPIPPHRAAKPAKCGKSRHSTKFAAPSCGETQREHLDWMLAKRTENDNQKRLHL